MSADDVREVFLDGAWIVLCSVDVTKDLVLAMELVDTNLEITKGPRMNNCDLYSHCGILTLVIVW